MVSSAISVDQSDVGDKKEVKFETPKSNPLTTPFRPSIGKQNFPTSTQSKRAKAAKKEAAKLEAANTPNNKYIQTKSQAVEDEVERRAELHKLAIQTQSFELAAIQQFWLKANSYMNMDRFLVNGAEQQPFTNTFTMAASMMNIDEIPIEFTSSGPTM